MSFYIFADFDHSHKPIFFAGSSPVETIGHARAYINQFPEFAELSDPDIVNAISDSFLQSEFELVEIPCSIPSNCSQENLFGLYMKYWNSEVPNHYESFQPEP